VSAGNAEIGSPVAHADDSSLRVLLIANYPLDEQQSMNRFAELISSGLRQRGIAVRTIRPMPRFGLLATKGSPLAKWLAYIDKFLIFPFVLRRNVRDFDLIHIIDHSNAMYRRDAMRTVVTCHDLLAVRSACGEFPEHPTGFTGKVLQRWILNSLHRADQIVCDSSATRQDVLRLIGRDKQDTSLVFPCLAEPFRHQLEQAKAIHELDGANRKPKSENGKPETEGRRPYILHVGGDAWYKNRRGVARIFTEVRSRLGSNAPDLILVGPRIEDFDEHVTALENVSEQDLIGLYRNAALLLFPSLGEGFGWPVIEAQACGCPVITTDCPPLTEVGGAGAAYLDDPTNVQRAAEVVIDVLTRPEKRKELKQKGLENARRFAGTQMVDQYAEVYSRVLNRI
jgi:glycosyltransferase involved in cell wall biosynthesis